ncbi:MAG: 4-hydroxy-3-polyprenylbenzoate decarboxylase, partial [Porticoccaceae bacterium]
THLILSQAAKMNIGIETQWSVADVEALADEVHNNKNIGASIASGSYKTAGMIVVPCSMKTLSGIANSYAENLIIRAADVMLKERRQLVIVPRESPLHTGHCELMLKASQIGAIICPPSPAFYTSPKTVDDIINHTVARVLDLFDIETDNLERWQGNV